MNTFVTTNPTPAMVNSPSATQPTPKSTDSALPAQDSVTSNSAPKSAPAQSSIDSDMKAAMTYQNMLLEKILGAQTNLVTVNKEGVRIARASA